MSSPPAMNDVAVSHSSTLHLHIAMASRTSKRSAVTVARMGEPWKFAAKHTYDAETNPEGMISFALAENVRGSTVFFYADIEMLI